MLSHTLMTPFRIKIWNYRSIPFNSPIEVEFDHGILFILGINNCGKSNLLRFIHDFKNSFRVARGNYSASYQISINSFYDHIVNRKFPDRGIQFDLYVKNHVVHYVVVPNGSPHSDSLIVNYSIESSDVSQKAHWTLIEESLFYLQNSLYIGAGRVVLQQTTGQYYDVEIGSTFYKRWSEWSAGGNLNRMEKIQTLKDELKELFGYKQFDIFVDDSKSRLYVRTDDGLFDLNDLGAGVSHFVFTLANALIKEPSIILIDEPETGLHPSLQQLFVQALAAKATRGVIATSHSIGLARSTGDRILSLVRDQNKVQLLPFGKHFSPSIGQSITELGYSQFAELGGNKILLVEGRTDIKAYREVLRLFKIEHNYIIMSFGGRQFVTKDREKIIDELAELNRFNCSVFVILDSEFESPKDELKSELATFQSVCVECGFTVFPTDLHSTENYASNAAVEKILGKSVKALDPFEKFDGRWPKEKNWLLFREMSKDDFMKTKLGAFIEKEMTPAQD